MLERTNVSQDRLRHTTNTSDTTRWIPVCCTSLFVMFSRCLFRSFFTTCFPAYLSLSPRCSFFFFIDPGHPYLNTRCLSVFIFFFLNDPAPPEISPLPLHDALPI